jgi:ABC-type multidrug transport system fused ATPase/permease subunit
MKPLFTISENFRQSYFTVLKSFFQFDRFIRFHSVDFQKPWWTLFLLQKWRYGFVIFSEIIQSIYEALFPLAIGFAISQQQYVYILYIVGVYIIFEVMNRFSSWIYQTSLASTQGSIMDATQTFFLTVDPIFHSTKSTGQISSKLQVAGREFVSLFGLIFFTIIPVLSAYFSVTVILLSFSTKIGLVALGFFVFITIISSILRYIHSHTLTEIWIKSRDKYIANQIENLSQNNYIRNSFATIEQIGKSQEINKQTLVVRNILSQGNGLIVFIVRLLYISSVLWIGYLVLDEVNAGNLTTILGTTMILTYINGSSQILKIGDFISQATESIQNMNDLWDFIRNFGKQTYPVESNSQNVLATIPPNPENYSIQLQNIKLNYNKNTKVLNNHSLFLDVSVHNQNKLYGIIGPSGSGKTTLISVLGGQLKPKKGSVKISGVDIYTVGDHERRQLISIQMKTATSIRGNVKKNLIFGLSGEDIYSDDELIQTLKNVGLWELFSKKDGLKTMIGEGGINLSGGQRQRLNFAGLYLRAKYFKPNLILIDEPTSSLDEISELAITKMILELASSALTLVVAHRLKTLDQAVGILDTSLLSTERELEFYSPKNLINKSSYYRDLLSGKAVLED